jgi:hypothetical protein
MEKLGQRAIRKLWAEPTRTIEGTATVTIVNPIPPAGAVKVELLRNGAAVPDGILNKLNGVTSRTWFLTGVKTLDLVARDKIYSSGQHAISVLL